MSDISGCWSVLSAAGAIPRDAGCSRLWRRPGNTGTAGTRGNCMSISELAAAALLSNSEDGDKAADLLLERLDKAAKRAAPRLKAMSQFRTQLDIEAVKQMQEAGLTQEQAVMLRASFNIDLSNTFNK